MKKVIISFLVLVASSAWGADVVGDLQSNAAKLFDTLVTLFHNTKWIFAIMPVAASFMAISKDISKIRESQQNMMQQEPVLKGEETANIAFHAILVLISFYIIYGVFGMTYADASSFGEMWDSLVMSFWRSIF